MDSGIRSLVSVQGSLAMFAIHRWGSEEQREQWRADAVDDRQVSVPEELDGLVATQRHLGEELAGLEIVMEDSPARRDYPELPVEQLVGVLEEMVNIGTLSAFVLVSVGVIVLRRTRPDLKRSFRVPWSPVLPVISALISSASRATSGR